MNWTVDSAEQSREGETSEYFLHMLATTVRKNTVVEWQEECNYSTLQVPLSAMNSSQ